MTLSFILSWSTRLTPNSEECLLSPCYVWYTRRSEPKDNVHLFSQVLQCHWTLQHVYASIHGGPPALKAVVSFQLIFLTFTNYTTQKMKRSGSHSNGSYRGLLWLGGVVWRSPWFTPDCVPSTPLGPWTMSHFGRLCMSRHSHLTPGLTLCQTDVRGGKRAATRHFPADCKVWNSGML